MDQNEFSTGGRLESGGIPLRDYSRMSPASFKRTMGGNGLMRLFGSNNADPLARILIFASLGLAAYELFFPRHAQKLVGLRRPKHTGLVRALGLRELTSAMWLYLSPRPTSAVWSRVAGDAMDLGLLGKALSMPRVKKNQTLGVLGAILGFTALDIFTGLRLNRQRKQEKSISLLTDVDLSGKTKRGSFHVTKSVTVNRSPEEIYTFWRNFENLPRFMYHLQSVRVIDSQRSHWVTSAPAGASVEWDAEIVEDQPNELIAWQSTANADVPNSGRVTFTPTPAGGETVVRVEIEYLPPAGAIGKVVALLFGEDAGQQIKGDLDRFKQIMETGEVMRSDGSPAGLGQKMQRPGRPMKDTEKEGKMPRVGQRQRQASGQYESIEDFE